MVPSARSHRLTTERLVLAGALALLAFATLRWHHDIVASDPLWYASLAHEISVDAARVFASPSNHPFEMRVGLTLPMALLYRAFGVSTVVSLIPQLVAGLAIVWIAYAAGTTPRARVLGALLAAACTPLFRNAAIVNVDLPCAALCGASLLFLGMRERPRGAAWIAVAMACWFAAFLVKESALWFLPTWLYAAFADVRRQGLGAVAKRYGPALALGAGLAVAYLAMCHRVWGDAFARFAGVAELGRQHNWSLAGKPAAQWAERLTWGPALLLGKMFRLTLAPAVLFGWMVRGPARLWAVATLSVTALFWLGSASWSTYDPLPLLPRMVLPVLVPLLVTAAAGLDAAWSAAQRRWPGRRAPTIAAVALLLAVAYLAFGSLRIAAKIGRPDSAAYRVLRDRIAQTRDPVVVVCGGYPCEALVAFHLGFSPDPHVTIASSASFAGAAPPAPPAKVFAITNAVRTVGASAIDGRFAALHDAAPEALRLLFGAGDVRLYEATSIEQLHRALQAP